MRVGIYIGGFKLYYTGNTGRISAPQSRDQWRACSTTRFDDNGLYREKEFSFEDLFALTQLGP